MQHTVFQVYTPIYTQEHLSDSNRLEERSDIWPSGEQAGPAESLPHKSLAETITDNHKSVIQCTQGGHKNKAEWAAMPLSHTHCLLLFVSGHCLLSSIFGRFTKLSFMS